MMTGLERVANQLKRKPVDRIAVYEHFWSDTQREWEARGQIPPNVDFADFFNFDMDLQSAVSMVADIGFVPVVLEETDETILRLDGNGATLRQHKLHSSTPEHVDFSVKDRTVWEEKIKPLLVPDRNRINFEKYRERKRIAKENNRFFFFAGINVFELMHPVCGHEYMLMGMVLDPDWVKDMVHTYSRLIVSLQEILFAEEGYPDGIWFYEDMGFKERPFMSPAMYDEIIKPGHKYTIDYAKSISKPVVMHSCGYVEPLIPGMLEAGIDCLQVIEVKAGMDLLRIYKNYGEVLSLMGGIDVRTLYSNDFDIINRELESKIPIVKQNYGFILHSDHSIPNTVNYESFKYFIERGKQLGTY
ncbi:MAG: uroporphyrinogen decarboxylase family protein [Clostridia bacterium]